MCRVSENTLKKEINNELKYETISQIDWKKTDQKYQNPRWAVILIITIYVPNHNCCLF